MKEKTKVPIRERARHLIDHLGTAEILICPGCKLFLAFYSDRRKNEYVATRILLPRRRLYSFNIWHIACWKDWLEDYNG